MPFVLARRGDDCRNEQVKAEQMPGAYFVAANNFQVMQCVFVYKQLLKRGAASERFIMLFCRSSLSTQQILRQFGDHATLTSRTFLALSDLLC